MSLQHDRGLFDAALAHDKACAAAAYHNHRAEERAKEHRRIELANTCPICESHDSTRIGKIEPRSLLPGDVVDRWGTLHSLRVFRSCAVCFGIAQAILLERWRAEEVAAGTQRESAVTAALDSLTG